MREQKMAQKSKKSQISDRRIKLFRSKYENFPNIECTGVLKKYGLKLNFWLWKSEKLPNKE